MRSSWLRQRREVVGISGHAAAKAAIDMEIEDEVGKVHLADVVRQTVAGEDGGLTEYQMVRIGGEDGRDDTLGRIGWRTLDGLSLHGPRVGLSGVEALRAEGRWQ